MLLGVDVEQVANPGHLEKGLHPWVDVDKLHVTAGLPNAAKTPGQFAQAVAVNEIYAGEINEELLVAVAGEDMNEVAQLSATVSQRESSHNIDHNDAIAFSGCDLKTHIWFAGWFFPKGIICWVERGFKAGGCVYRRVTQSLRNWEIRVAK